MGFWLTQRLRINLNFQVIQVPLSYFFKTFVDAYDLQPSTIFNHQDDLKKICVICVICGEYFFCSFFLLTTL